MELRIDRFLSKNFAQEDGAEEKCLRDLKKIRVYRYISEANPFFILTRGMRVSCEDVIQFKLCLVNNLQFALAFMDDCQKVGSGCS